MANKNGFLCSSKGNRVVINFAALDGKKAVIVGGHKDANRIVEATINNVIKTAHKNGQIKIFESREDAEQFLSPVTDKKKADDKKGNKGKSTLATTKAPATSPTAPADPTGGSDKVPLAGDGGEKTGNADQ